MKASGLLRAAVLAGLLMGSAATSAVAITDARASQPVAEDAPAPRVDWPLLAMAFAALVIGRTVVHRRSKSSDSARR